MSSDRLARVTTASGLELDFRRMTMTEQVGRLFEMEIDLVSEDAEIALPDVLARSLTVHLVLPDESERFFDGIVSRFSLVGTIGRNSLYRATVRPWLWLLTRTSDCRIFQNKTVPDIIKEVFREHGFSDFDERLSETYRTWDYCVQYRETDFNFVSRLMENEGIYYYFEHEDGKHVLVLADSYSAHQPFPGYDTVPYFPEDPNVRREQDHVYDWLVTQEVQPGSCALCDYDFVNPKSDLLVSSAVSREHPAAEFEMYDYPGVYTVRADGDSYVRRRIEELQSQYEVASGRGNARGIACGALFTLDGFRREDQNREYLVTSVHHQLEAEDYETGTSEAGQSLYECSFTVIDSQQPFRSPRITPKPVVQGPQTAVVVGPSGEEIYTDEHGRVKVQFHWDRYGTMDENSSCWVRVAQLWAGKGWGGMAVPRIGQEVVIDFLEGDPDQPIVTGRVYNGDNRPPFALPDSGMVSGLKSNSTPGGGGYNEMSMNDTKGEEKIVLHGQYDMESTIEHDQTLTVNNNRTDTIAVDDSETVGNNQTLSVGVDQTQTIGSNQTVTIGADQTLNVGANQNVQVGSSKSESVGVSKSLSIGAAYQVSVGAVMNESVGGAKAEEIGGAKIVEVGAISSEDVGASKSVSAGSNISHDAGSDISMDAGAKMTLTSGADFNVKSSAKAGVDAADQIMLKCGGASIILKSGGDIIIKGAKITIKGSGDVKIKGSKIAEN